MILVYRYDWHERRKNAIENEAAICAAYASGLSAAQTAKQFGVSGKTVFNILKRTSQAARSSGEGISLRWKDAGYTAHQVAMRIGKAPGNKGMTYTIGRPISKPNLLGEKTQDGRVGDLLGLTESEEAGSISFGEGLFLSETTTPVFNAANAAAGLRLITSEHLAEFWTITASPR